MDSQPSPKPRETGAALHRRETWMQIYLPYIGGLALLLALVLIVGLPGHSDWRLRAEAIASLSYSLLCLLPILLTLFIPYLLLLVAIYGMRVLHRSTEKPLRRLENAAASLAGRINELSSDIDEKAVAFDEALAPAYKVFSIFDMPEEESHEPREQNPN